MLTRASARCGVARAPFRNVLRAPRRSLLTALGVGAAIGVLVGMAGMMDTFDAAIRQGESEMVGERPDRVTVTLAGFLPETTVETAIAAEPTVGSTAAGLRVGAEVTAHGTSLGLLLSLVDLRADGWQPTVVAGTMPDGRGNGPGGILLAEGAARDLGVAVGDEIVLRHPQRTGPTTVGAAETTMRVVGLHPSPIRAVAYLDLADADLLGLEGLVNVLDIEPAAGATQADVIRAVFNQPGVASVEPITLVVRAYGDLTEELKGFLALVEGVALLLALLVAFNSASIATDERAREHATMLAFGVPVRRILGIEVVESVILGLAGTIVGILIGLGVVTWFMGSVMPETMPDLAVGVFVAPATYVIAIVVGVLVVGLAPLLMARRLRRMDLPGTLRLVE